MARISSKRPPEVVGSHATAIALGMGASVIVADRDREAPRRLDARFRGAARSVVSNRTAIAQIVKRADLLICAVLLPDARTPKLVAVEMLATMKPPAVIVDVAIDRGGCCESLRPTSHSNPTFVSGGVVHYCVPNMPGVVSRTSSFALNNATLLFVLAIADKGWRRALREDANLRAGFQISGANVVSQVVAQAHELPCTSLEEALKE